MNILETYYTYAKLSQAAYIDLSSKGQNFTVDDIIALAVGQERVPRALVSQLFGKDATDPDYHTNKWGQTRFSLLQSNILSRSWQWHSLN